MPKSSLITVILSILLPATLYFRQSYKERLQIKDLKDFFPLRRIITSGEYRSTTVAAGMSLATVIVAFINLAPFLGLTLLVSVITYSLSFAILYPCVERIMTENPDNDTIQSYLGKSYNSNMVRYVALSFSMIGYVSIFCMELIVGVTVLEPFLGKWVFSFAVIFLIFILIYSLMSGYRAIVITDKWQLLFIIASISILVIFGFLQFYNNSANIELSNITKAVTSSWVPAWAFILGITVMNLPAPISDGGTWQRVCSTKNSIEAKKGLIQVVILFTVLWGVLVIFGCYYSSFLKILYTKMPSDQPLISYIIEIMSKHHSLNVLFIFVFFVGLFSAMISTSDSLLIVSGQILAIDFLKLQEKNYSSKEMLRKARIGMLIIALLSFIVFSIFYLLSFDVVQLVFSIYGAQLAMFPSVFVSLFLSNKINLDKAKYAAVFSIFWGFVGGWASAIYGKYSGDLNWLYNAPVSSLSIAIVVYTIFALPTLKYGNK